MDFESENEDIKDKNILQSEENCEEPAFVDVDNPPSESNDQENKLQGMRTPVILFQFYIFKLFVFFFLLYFLGYVVIPLTEENMRAVAMENDSFAEIEVDAYLSGSVVEALTQKSVDIQEEQLNTALNNANVEIQAGSEDFKVQCQNIGKGPDGILRMCVLDNGEVINSLKNHIDTYAVPEIINNGYEGVYEDNSETILNIASESIQSTQFLENAVAKDPLTIRQTAVRNSDNKENDKTENTDGYCEDYAEPTWTKPSLPETGEIFKELDLVGLAANNNQNEDSGESGANNEWTSSANEFFMPDFETLLWNENNTMEPSYLDIDKFHEQEDNKTEYIDIGDFEFLSKSITRDDTEKDGAVGVEKDDKNSGKLSNNLKEILETCSNKGHENGNKKNCHKNCSKNDSEKSTCCVTVCLNTLKQLRKVLEQRCCMAGKTSLI